ncbi:MAG: hypothetical protein IT236_16830 [Bacteroidia bacterium]|nr:hypothetical protein [Bacteroidia bacterium]
MTLKSQTADSTRFKNKYLHFLAQPGKGAQARMLTVSYQFLYSPPGGAFRTCGLYPGFGWNLARFVSDKFILGICVDAKGVKGFTRQYFSSEFTNDFNSAYIQQYTDPRDSARAGYVKDAINGKGMHGNYLGNIGIMFSPFPQKYGGILIIVKKGYRDYPIFGTYGDKRIADGERENVSFDLSGNFSLEVSLKPVALFQNTYINLNEEEFDISKLFTLSFYYERLQLKNASFDGMPLKNMVNASFMNKYGITQSFGFKIGLMLY